MSLGYFQTGDVFRISREGNVVRFYKNGAVVRTVGTSPALELKVKACIQVSGKSTPAITASFDSTLILFGSVTGIDGNVGSGSITVAVSGGSVPYTYSWSSGEQTNSITNKPHGSYTVTVTDAVGRQQSRTYSLGYKINWVNQVGVSASNGVLTKTAQNGSFSSAGAISSNLLPPNTNGWIEFSGVNGADYMVGLAANDVYNYTEFANGVLVDIETGAVKTYGTASVSLGNFQTGDVFRISREGNSVKYYRNGVVLLTLSVSASLELKVKATISVPGHDHPQHKCIVRLQDCRAWKCNGSRGK